MLYLKNRAEAIDRRRRVEPFVSISAKSKALVQSSLLDCHKEVAQKGSEMEKRARPSSKNGGTSRDMSRVLPCVGVGGE